MRRLLERFGFHRLVGNRRKDLASIPGELSRATSNRRESIHYRFSTWEREREREREREEGPRGDSFFRLTALSRYIGGEGISRFDNAFPQRVGKIRTCRVSRYRICGCRKKLRRYSIRCACADNVARYRQTEILTNKFYVVFYTRTLYFVRYTVAISSARA